MKIVELKAENVKRLKAVEIRPDGAVVQITGRNAQGKSSVLDSIAMALGGKDWLGAQPIRNGQDKGKIVCALDNGLTVTRTLTAAGGTLTVTNADGAKYPSPQAVLDKLVGRLSFDPLAFSRMQPKQQVETLKSLVGLDFAALDAERAQLFARRTEVNRSVKALETQVAAAPSHADAAAEEVSVTSLMAELRRVESLNAERRAVLDNAGRANIRVSDLDREIALAESQLATLRARRVDAAEEAGQLGETANAMQMIDVNPIRDSIANADTINRKVRENAARAQLEARLAKVNEDAADLTRGIDSIDAEKTNALTNAKFPVEGLTFDDTGVAFNGVPFSQASSAEQLRVSVAMGLSMNPQLKVLLIRDGSLLDDGNLATIAEMADAAGAQVWIERVDESGTVGIVIEDGQVAGVAEAVAP